MATGRNPTWARDELMLALDIYLRNYPTIPSSKTNKDVVELSQLLNALPIFPREVRQPNFRNPDGVLMKLMNFRWIDPNKSGGYSSVGQGDRDVWAEFAHQPDQLHQLAVLIREHYQSPEVVDQQEESEIDLEAPEGRLLRRVHVARERNRTIVNEKKKSVRKRTGRLSCECCDFDFADTYGDLGDGYIECHHTIPVAQLDQDSKTKMSDLALVCANCHRMLHASRPMIEVAELKA